jgi:hypothetical protein
VTTVTNFQVPHKGGNFSASSACVISRISMHQATVSLGSCQNTRTRFELAEGMFKFRLFPLDYACSRGCTLQAIKTRTGGILGDE